MKKLYATAWYRNSNGARLFIFFDIYEFESRLLCMKLYILLPLYLLGFESQYVKGSRDSFI